MGACGAAIPSRRPERPPHRSVYIVDRLAEEFAGEFRNVTARHSGLPGAKLFQPPPRAASGAQVAQDAATE